jgi:archaeal flagellar protein FlaJ
MISKYAFRLFGDIANKIEYYFPDLRSELKKADLKISPQEYIANSLFVSLMSFVFTLPFLSFFISLASASFLFGYLTSITLAIGIPILVFMIYLNYPKFIIRDREKKIDTYLPFSTIYLSSIISSGLPLHKVIKTLVEFTGHKYFADEMRKILNDVELYGLDILSALERNVDKTPSRKLREFLYGLLSTIRSGGDVYKFTKEKAEYFLMDYKRMLSTFSHSMTIYTEIYLVAVVLGTIFFIILTTIVSIINPSQNILGIQIFMIVVFLPLISIFFLFLVKKSQPFWE